MANDSYDGYDGYDGCPSCNKGGVKNCEECCEVVENRCEKFGYQQDVWCECHDICVQDVKLICVRERTIVIPIAGANGVVGCRGEVEITGTPQLAGCRVFCAQESLQTADSAFRCLAINNKVGVEVTLRVPRAPLPDLLLVHRYIDEFQCPFTDFYTFPEGIGFDDNQSGRDAFREIIKSIDGSCKTVIIEDCRVENTTCPQVVVELKVIEKLWKHENLLVSAIKPYPENITVSEVFNDLHHIGSCPPPCPRQNT
ncbi:MAG: hypothetical protein ACOYBM_03945 [Dethiobacteria bacterium]|jgi:hypothetical protein